MSRSGALKLSKLRELMTQVPTRDNGRGIQALLVASEDAHLSEYITDHDKRREFISGFKGSLGTAVITQKEAALWTDGRYYSQAETELDPPDAWILMKRGTAGTPNEEDWLISQLPENSTVGADPNLVAYSTWLHLEMMLGEAGHSLIPLKENLIDRLWGDDQPALTLNPIVPQPLKFTGQKSCEKIAKCRAQMVEQRVRALVITNLDEIAYLLNLRGSDIPYNPVFFAYVILTQSDVHFFVDKSRLTPEAEAHLIDEEVQVVYHPYDDVKIFLQKITSETAMKDDKIWIHHNANYALHYFCEAVKKHVSITPTKVMQIVKNEVEIESMKRAHLRDAAALVKYFAWLEDRVKSKAEPPETEISGASQLEKFRSEMENFVGLSFPTISSVGAHGAIIHYSPSPATDVPITDKEIYLCDSGAQYYDGTTDVTRTFHFGEPTSFQRECFTRVFKGQTALATAIFPIYLKGNYLDTLARKSLWDVGLHYLHGTGHGVGAYLNVHEGPNGISWRPLPDDPGVQPGVFFSNEPGFYEDGQFGIRLENVQYVVPTTTTYHHRDLQFLTFEPVTFVPIQTTLLDISLLTDEEITYLNNYHARCLELLRPLLQGEENVQALKWLEKETRPISR
ncbi:xaa-Pro aminopeptidase ApepP [Diachasmimorpha longicaudata]|uniref:xaa-Pro aminopeptidase ApepP n=1 Tax=Diachasmimorpha longicaudata TaxID=58733 RepID=UPI0030B8A064